jgi:Na+/H+-translocating membrane pyrophosphatase
MNWERTFQFLAVVLAAIAAYFYWRGLTDAMFVSAVLGAVAFFLGIRMQVRTRMAERAAESEIHTSAE